MATTTIRLPEELKERIAIAAERTGKTTHSLILEAIAEKADLEEQRAEFEAVAEARFAKIVDSGKTIPWPEVRQYLEDRLQGRDTERPRAKTKRT